MKDSIVESCYVAPWALPNEELPFHFILTKDAKFDKIVVDFPQGVKLKRFLNVEKYRSVNSSKVIEKLFTPSYFGGVIVQKDIFEETHVKKCIDVRFFEKNREIEVQAVDAFFFRPRIEVVKYPDMILLDDRTKARSMIDLEFRVLGFGRVDIKLEWRTGGSFKTNPEHLYQELVRRLFAMYLDFKFEEAGQTLYAIDKTGLQEKSRELVNRMLDDEIPIDVDKDTLEHFKEWLRKKNEEEQGLEGIVAELQRLLLDSLLFHLDRYPEDNIGMMFGKPSLIVTDVSQQIEMRFSYRDAAFNEYDPIMVSMRVDDRRKNPKEAFNLPVRIKWDKRLIEALAVRQSQGV